MFELAKYLHEAFRTNNPWLFVLYCGLMIGVLGSFAGYVIDRGYQRALQEKSSDALPQNRPEIIITKWGPNTGPEYPMQNGFYLHNAGRETAIGIELKRFLIELPTGVPSHPKLERWMKGNVVSFLDRDKDDFLPVYAEIGSVLDRFQLEGFLNEAFKEARGNQIISISISYSDGDKKKYTTKQDMTYSPELRRIAGFGPPEQTLEK